MNQTKPKPNYFQSVRASCVRHRLNTPIMTVSRPHVSTPQSSVAITNYTLTAPYFTYPEKIETRIELDCFGELNTGPPAHMSEHTSQRYNDLTNVACQTAIE